jgi:hypothetical protein
MKAKSPALPDNKPQFPVSENKKCKRKFYVRRVVHGWILSFSAFVLYPSDV